MNEPEDDAKWTDAKWTDATRAYLRDALPLVRQTRSEPSAQPSASPGGSTGLPPSVCPTCCNIIEYCSKKHLFEIGPDRVSQTIAGQRKSGGGRPLLIGEFGMSTARDPQHGADESLWTKMGDAPGTEAEQARLYEIVLAAAEKDRVAGVLSWCLCDYSIENPNESHFGLVHRMVP